MKTERLSSALNWKSDYNCLFSVSEEEMGSIIDTHFLLLNCQKYSLVRQR